MQCSVPLKRVYSSKRMLLTSVASPQGARVASFRLAIFGSPGPRSQIDGTCSFVPFRVCVRQDDDGHPYGVEPLGNIFLGRSSNCKPKGLGALAIFDVSFHELSRLARWQFHRHTERAKMQKHFTTAWLLWLFLSARPFRGRIPTYMQPPRSCGHPSPPPRCVLPPPPFRDKLPPPPS